jgi:hypothetical protein
MATAAQRHQALLLMEHLYAERGRVHYPLHDVRRELVGHISSVSEILHLIARPGGWSVDCSQMAEAIHRAIGLHLPFRDGFTGSYLAHLPRYSDARHALIAAPVVFGPGTGHHMALVFRPDPHHGNPLLFSHGQEADPRLITLADEQRYQPHPATFCSIAKL